MTNTVMDRLMGDFAAAAGTVLTAVGLKVGLWDALAAGPGSVEEVAARCGVDGSYAREWLRSQAAGGYVLHDESTGRFSLAPGVDVAVVGSGRGLVEGMCSQLEVWWAGVDRHVDAFLTGGGICWGELPPAHAGGMDAVTRTVVTSALVDEWVPAVEGLVSKLASGATVADVGCGYGAPTIAMAQAFPSSRFVGFDVDDASVPQARRAAAAAGVDDRARFEVAHATAVNGGPYDLIVFVDSLHDFGRPDLALATARSVLADDGVVLLVEHAGSDRLEDNLHPVGRFFYACSALVCTANALADDPDGIPLGALPGEDALRRVAARAGFTRVSRLDVDAPFNLLLELRP